MSGPDNLSAKDQVLVAVHELEAVAKRFDLPVVVIVALPKSREVIKFNGNLTLGNLPKIAEITAKFLRSCAQHLQGGAP